MNDIFIGIDLGGTNIKVGCFDGELNLINKTSTATKADMGPDVVVDRICSSVEKLLAENNLSSKAITAIGIGSPGPLDLVKGTIIAAPNLTGFKNVPLRKMVSERLFSKPTVLNDDARAACWGEYVVGAGKGVEHMAFFTLGTGVGGGVITNGKLIHGFGTNAAALGHIIIHPGGRLCGCGQRGCIEAYASANSTAARATEAIQAGGESSLKDVLDANGRITCKDVFEHSAAGDTLAKEITEGTADALGLVCVIMLHVTGPKRIVFAGGMTAAGDMLLDRIKHYFNKHIWSMKEESVEICFAALGGDAGITGGAALAKQAIEQKNSN